MLLLATLPGATPSRAAGQQRWFTAEFDAVFLTGEFGGNETTDLLYLPFILKSQARRYEFTFTMPFLIVEGPPSLVVDGGPVVPGLSGKSEQRSGPGDIVLKGEYFFVAGDMARRPWVSLLGKLKVPTASEDECLGTGEVDWSVGASYTQPFGNRVTGFLEVSRKQVGDPSKLDTDCDDGEASLVQDVDFDDTTAVVVGASARFGSKTSVYLVYDKEDSIVPGLVEGESLNLGINVLPDDRWRVSASVFAGLTDTREDFGILLGLARTWNVSQRPGR